MVLEMKQHARTYTFSVITLVLLANTSFGQFFGMGKNRSYHDQVVERTPQAQFAPSCATGNCTPSAIGWGYHYEKWSRWPGSPTFRRSPLTGHNSKSTLPKVDVPSDLDESSVIGRKRGSDDEVIEDAAPSDDSSQPPLFEEPPVDQPTTERELPTDVVPEIEEEEGTTELPDSFFDDQPTTQPETPALEGAEPSTDDLFDDFESDSGSPLDDLFDDSSMFDLDQFERREPRRINQKRIARNHPRPRKMVLKDIPMATRSSNNSRLSSVREKGVQLEALPSEPSAITIRDRKKASSNASNLTSKQVASAAKRFGNPLRQVGAGMVTNNVRTASFVEAENSPMNSPERATKSASVPSLQLKETASAPSYNPLRGK